MNLLCRLLEAICPDAALHLPHRSPWPPLDPGPSVPRFDAFQARDLAERDAKQARERMWFDALAREQHPLGWPYEAPTGIEEWPTELTETRRVVRPSPDASNEGC